MVISLAFAYGCYLQWLLWATVEKGPLAGLHYEACIGNHGAKDG